MKKLAIVGAEEHTRNHAPWEDESFDIWVVNEWVTAEWCKRYTASIDIHWEEIYTDPRFDREGKYWQWLKQAHGKPVYMQKVDPDVPDSVEYPLKEINRLFLSNLTYQDRPVKNFRSSISYCIALALYLGYEQIDIYGVELVGIEYKGQAQNFAFWVGLATGRGVRVNAYCSQGTFLAPLYDYEAFMHSSKSQSYLIGINEQGSSPRRAMPRLRRSTGARSTRGRCSTSPTCSSARWRC